MPEGFYREKLPGIRICNDAVEPVRLFLNFTSCATRAIAAILVRSRGYVGLQKGRTWSIRWQSCQRLGLSVVSELPLSRSVHEPPLGQSKSDWVELEGCETPKYAVRREGYHPSEPFSGNWIFRENSVDSEIRAVTAEHRGEFPISADQCREDQTRLRAEA